MPVTALTDGESDHGHPMFLPDGKHFIYSRVSSQAGTSGIYVGSIDAKADQQSRKILLNDLYAMFAPGETPDRGYLIFERQATLMAQPFDAGKLELSGEAQPLADLLTVYIRRGLFTVSKNGTLGLQHGNCRHVGTGLAGSPGAGPSFRRSG